MRTFGVFENNGEIFHGEVFGEMVQPLSGPYWLAADSPAGRTLPLTGLTIGVPATPSKIIAVGKNYHAHAAERGEPAPTSPLTWLKAPTSLLAHGGEIELPFPDHRVDFEVELTIVIGRRAKNVRAADAGDYIFGYAIGLDISDRDVQDAEKQYARAKGFDTFTPLGPFVHNGVEAGNLPITLRQNGELRQNGNTAEMIFKPHEILEFVSRGTTLLPGDIIMTGTPAGVGPIREGDAIEAAIGPFMPLRVSVRNA